MPQSAARKRAHKEETSGESPVKKREDKEKEGEELLSNTDVILESVDVGANTVVEDTDTEDYFPIMALPIELISHTLSFLSMVDRLRVAGVNKKLNAIELESKYHVESMLIEEKSIGGEEQENEEKDGDDADSTDDSGLDYDDEEYDQRITFSKEKSYSSDCIRRIAKNVSIGFLQIRLTGSDEFHRQVYNLIKEFDIRHLHLHYEDDKTLKDMMEDSFFLDLTRACKSMYVDDCEKITEDAIHQVYKNMMDGSTKLRSFRTCQLHEYTCINFLALIGIIYRDEKFYSNRDIEVYKYNLGYIYNIFVGAIEIKLGSPIFRFDNDIFELDFHETRESLEEAKNRMKLVRIDIYPE